jgi:hypothetical protein
LRRVVCLLEIGKGIGKEDVKSMKVRVKKCV